MMMNFRIRPAVAWSVLWIAALASASGAAEVTKVRIGRHPTFTRVVFELDAPAGYRVERRADTTGDATSILVTMEARAEARTIANRAGMVESVTVQEQRGRAVARIRLREPQLRLKEMILSNPPRIVLDVMHDQQSMATTKPSTRARGIAKTPPPKSEPVEPKPAVSRPSPVPKPVKSQPRPVTTPVEPPTVARNPSAPESPAPKSTAVEVSRTPSGTLAESGKPALPDATEARKNEDTIAVVTPPTAPKPSVRQKRKPVSPPKSTASPPTFVQSLSDSTGLSPVMLAAGSAGAVLAVVGFIVFRRRRGASAEAHDEFDADGNLFSAEPGSEAGSTSAEANAPVGATGSEADATAVPAFGDTGEGSLFGDLDPSNVSDTQRPQPEAAPLAGPGGGLFGDDEKEESTVDSMSTPTAGMDASAAPGAMPPVGDLARIVAELEQRLNSVETRLDESVEACERLERQMAAQSEELRVQRAAIARTQRALRSLSRTDEEQATEPAIREPR